MILLACAEPESGSGTLEVLSYNVHGLPPAITGDDTDARMAQIAPLLEPYSVLGLQEVWEQEYVAALDLDLETRVSFDDALDDRAYGSGLLSYAAYPASDVQTEWYDACYGTIDNASDCFASKGWIAVRLVLADGIELDFYDSHLEAGGGEEDDAARGAQVDALVAAMNGYSEGRAVLFVGDTNLGGDDPEDVVLIDRWMEEAGLVNACDAIGCAEPERIDRILYRSGGGVTLGATSWSVEAAFVDGQGTPLSDHEAIAATIAWTYSPRP